MHLITRFSFPLVFIALLVIASVATLGVGWLLPLRKRLIITSLTQHALTFVLRVLCRVQVEIHYHDEAALAHYRAQGRSLLVVANHQSRWETFYLQGIFYPLINVLKRELLYIPLLGWAIACYRPVALNRSRAVTSIKKIQVQGTARLQAGYNLLIFPQATRVPVGHLGHISGSAARLGVASQAVIVPVVHNAGALWPRNQLFPRPGTIRVEIGTPLDCTGETPQQINSSYTAFFKTHILNQA